MSKTIHFISGLPHSGSTLLCNILAQNPSIHTTPASGCHEILFGIRNQWDALIEHPSAQNLSEEKNLQRVLRAVLNAYHDTDRPVILDQGFGWLSLLEMAEFALGRKAKVIVPVRSLSQICASFEKLHRKTAHCRGERGDDFAAQTVRGRTGRLLSNQGVIGLAYNRLKDAVQRGLADRLLFVEFDQLTRSPQKTLNAIYDFLALDPYHHNFDCIEPYAHEDAAACRPPLHAIRKTVAPFVDDSIEVLGPDLVRQLIGTEFWRTGDLS